MSNVSAPNDSSPVGIDVPFAMTIHVRDHCLCLHTQRAARAVSRIFDEAFRPFGIRSGQYSLLISLNRPEPPTLGSVANLLAMDRTTLTANLKPLERDGLLQVVADKADRRARRLQLTEKGRELLGRATPIWVATHAAIEARLADGGADRLRGDLDGLLRPRTERK